MESEEVEEIFAEEDESYVENTSLINHCLQWCLFAFQFISSYGWFIVAGIVFVLYILRKFQPAILNWRQFRLDNEESALSHRDADKFVAQHRSMELARLRMQEEINHLSVQEKEKQKEKEEQKRRQKIEEWEKFQEGGSFRSRRRVEENESSASTSNAKPNGQSKNNKTLRDDYNPLMGSGQGACFRPSRRGGAGGGG